MYEVFRNTHMYVCVYVMYPKTSSISSTNVFFLQILMLSSQTPDDFEANFISSCALVNQVQDYRELDRLAHVTKRDKYKYIHTLRYLNVFDHIHIMFVHSEDTFVRIIRPDKMKQRNAESNCTLHFILNLLQHHSLGRDQGAHKGAINKNVINIADKIKCK